MKKRFIVLLLPLFLIGLSCKFDAINTFPLFGKLIILDPGHGADDPGSVFKDEYEKDYNLTFSRTLKNVLEKYGATVIMTRNRDYDLSSPKARSRKRSDFDNRIKLINDDDPDVYLSLHMNYLSDTKYYGSQVFYSEVVEKNRTLAETIQKELNSYFKFDKDFKKIGKDKYMYGKLKVPGVLIEYGFMSSYKDRTNLKKESYRQELASVIADALVAYFT